MGRGGTGFCAAKKSRTCERVAGRGESLAHSAARFAQPCRFFWCSGPAYSQSRGPPAEDWLLGRCGGSQRGFSLMLRIDKNRAGTAGVGPRGVIFPIAKTRPTFCVRLGTLGTWGSPLANLAGGDDPLGPAARPVRHAIALQRTIERQRNLSLAIDEVNPKYGASVVHFERNARTGACRSQSSGVHADPQLRSASELKETAGIKYAAGLGRGEFQLSDTRTDSMQRRKAVNPDRSTRIHHRRRHRTAVVEGGVPDRRPHRRYPPCCSPDTRRTPLQ